MLRGIFVDHVFYPRQVIMGQTMHCKDCTYPVYRHRATDGSFAYCHVCDKSRFVDDLIGDGADSKVVISNGQEHQYLLDDQGAVLLFGEPEEAEQYLKDIGMANEIDRCVLVDMYAQNIIDQREKT